MIADACRPWQHQIDLLQTIPGVAEKVAQVIIAETGADGSIASGSQSSIVRPVGTLTSASAPATLSSPTRPGYSASSEPNHPSSTAGSLDLLGYIDGDQLDALHPGTGGMTRAIEAPILPLQTAPKPALFDFTEVQD